MILLFCLRLSYLGFYLLDERLKAGIAEGIAMGIAEGGEGVDEMTLFVKPKRVAYSATFRNQSVPHIQMLENIA